jgi:hypothetical protein
MTNQTNSPFFIETENGLKEINPLAVYIRALDSISNYRSVVSDEPYQASFRGIVKNDNGLDSVSVTILYCDMLEAIKMLNDQHKYIASRVVESAYHIIKSQIEFQNQHYE